MNVTGLVPKTDNFVRFHLSKVGRVPAVSGAYALTTFDGAILYIGLSTNIQRRVTEHLVQVDKTLPTIDGRATWFYWVSCEEPEQLERCWLNQFVTAHARLPIFNKVASPVSI